MSSRACSYGGAAVLFLVVGCSELFAFPDSEAENSAFACSDGRDNDFDGDADCSDLGCSMFCRFEGRQPPHFGISCGPEFAMSETAGVMYCEPPETADCMRSMHPPTFSPSMMGEDVCRDLSLDTTCVPPGALDGEFLYVVDCIGGGPPGPSEACSLQQAMTMVEARSARPINVVINRPGEHTLTSLDLRDGMRLIGCNLGSFVYVSEGVTLDGTNIELQSLYLSMLPSSRGGGSVVITSGSEVRVSDVVVDYGVVGVRVEEGAQLEGDRLYVARARTWGLVVEPNARVRLDNASLYRAEEGALDVDGGSVSISNTLIHGDPEMMGGVGIRARGRADVLVRASLIESAGTSGVELACEGGPQPLGDLCESATACTRACGSLHERCREVPWVQLEQVTIRENEHTGLAVGCGVAELRHVIFTDNAFESIRVDGGRVAMNDVLVTSTVPGLFAPGHDEGPIALYVTGGGVATGARLVIAGTPSPVVATGTHADGPSRIELTDVLVEGEGGSSATGVLAELGGEVSLERFEISRAGLCGVRVAGGGRVELTRGNIEFNARGACLESEDDLVLTDVAFGDNVEDIRVGNDG